VRDLCESIHLIIGWLTERAYLQSSKFGDTLHRLALATAVLELIGVSGCATKFLDQTDSVQGTRTEDLRDWVREDKQRNKLILFVHGFNSSKDEAWGEFPDLIKTDEDFASFNLHRFGYRTAILSQSTDIEHEGEFLASFLKETLPQYRSTILVGHSMGGLVILHALLTLERDAFKLLSDANLRVVTFGTPYQGVKNAGALATLFNNVQAQDMEIFSRAYVRLRENWERRINRPATLGERESPQVPIFSYSGTADDFVDRASARGAPGLVADRGTVDGDHVSMVKPKDRAHLAYQKLKTVALTGTQRASPASQGKIGILVARLTGDDASYAEQRGVIGRLEHLISQTEPQLYEAVEIRKLPVEIQGNALRDKEQAAKRLGQEHHAAIVVWGEVTKQAGVVELQPRVTLVKPLSLSTKTVVLAPLSPHASQLPHLNRPPETVHVPPLTRPANVGRTRSEELAC
jgi:pimeloyl-ACP methyl ester carboxylesterase